jgi:hypothetical protein
MTDLIKRLEEAEAGSLELDVAIWDAMGGWSVAHPPAYTTSLDAALALAERLGLDGWRLLYAAMLNWKAHDPRGPLSKTLPLALCIAILKAADTGRTAND